jgi:hypothetical protein
MYYFFILNYSWVLLLLQHFFLTNESNASNIVMIRFKALKSGQFSAYPAIYSKGITGKGKRNYEFLNIYVDKDYFENCIRVKAA